MDFAHGMIQKEIKFMRHSAVSVKFGTSVDIVVLGKHTTALRIFRLMRTLVVSVLSVADFGHFIVYSSRKHLQLGGGIAGYVSSSR